jgi:hypothetical protein
MLKISLIGCGIPNQFTIGLQHLKSENDDPEFGNQQHKDIRTHNIASTEQIWIDNRTL